MARKKKDVYKVKPLNENKKNIIAALIDEYDIESADDIQEDASFFLCKELEPGCFDGITGEYTTPEGYFVDENEAEEFDKQFPVKEKLKLPGQLF